METLNAALVTLLLFSQEGRAVLGIGSDSFDHRVDCYESLRHPNWQKYAGCFHPDPEVSYRCRRLTGVTYRSWAEVQETARDWWALTY